MEATHSVLPSTPNTPICIGLWFCTKLNSFISRTLGRLTPWATVPGKDSARIICTHSPRENPPAAVGREQPDAVQQIAPPCGVRARNTLDLVRQICAFSGSHQQPDHPEPDSCLPQRKPQAETDRGAVSRASGPPGCLTGRGQFIPGHSNRTIQNGPFNPGDRR